MSDFFFVVKSLVFTIIIVLLMQIKIGERTIEQRSMKWLHESAAIDNLQLVASGAVKAIAKGARGFAALVSDTSENWFEEDTSAE